MRETVRSLRAYFIVAGLLLGGHATYSLLAQPLGWLLLAFIIPVFLGAAYLYVGIRLRTLLVTSPRQVVFVVLSNGALIAIDLALSVAAASLGDILWCIAGC